MNKIRELFHKEEIKLDMMRKVLLLCASHSDHRLVCALKERTDRVLLFRHLLETVRPKKFRETDSKRSCKCCSSVVLPQLSIPFKMRVLFENSKHPVPEKQCIPFWDRVQCFID